MIAISTEPKKEAVVATSSEQNKELSVNETEESSSSLLDLDFNLDLDLDTGPHIDSVIPQDLVINQANLVNNQAVPLMEIDEVITLTTTNNDHLRITKSSLSDLINQIELAKAAIQGSRLINNKDRNNFSSNFIHDNGATSHIVTDRHLFYSYKEVNKVVYWGSARSIKIQGIGNVYVQFKDTGTKLLLRNALHVPELGVNIVNQSKMTNHYSLLTPTNAIIFNYYSGKIATIGDMINGLYYLPVRVIKLPERVCHTQDSESKSQESKFQESKSQETVNMQLIHQRMGYIGLKALHQLQENTLGYTITKKKGFDIDACPVCNEAKMIAQRHKVPTQ